MKLLLHFRKAKCVLHTDKLLEPEKISFSGLKINNVIEIGVGSEKLIGRVNKAIQGLVMSCYIYSLFAIVVMAFQMVSNISLNEVHTPANRILWVSICLLGTIMYLVRLNFMMKAGQSLGNTINLSRRTLEDLIIQTPPSKLKEEEVNILTILRKRLEAYQYLPPITPYSVFSLNNRTFYSTMTIMITYMVVLIKLRFVGNTSNLQSLQQIANMTLPD